MVSTVPEHPKIYHITHIDNLPLIVQDGYLWSDARCQATDIDSTIVGMSSIKRRRIEELEVKCYPDTRVGDYVPFYFCPRSIMLYILYMSNHLDLTYRGGQRSIIHLQADMKAAVEWADSNGRRWSFTDRNAGARVAKFFNSLDNLDEISWAAVRATDFRNPVIKEGKQAEFLVHDSFPWELVERIGVHDVGIRTKVEEALDSAEHKPLVTVERAWYY